MNIPHFAFYPHDWMSDTRVQQLTFEERGVYFDILCHMWIYAGERGEFGLPNDDAFMQRLLKLRPAKWAKLRAVLIDGVAPVLQVENGRIINRRLFKEYLKAKEKSEKASAAARARHERDNEPETDHERDQKTGGMLSPSAIKNRGDEVPKIPSLRESASAGAVRTQCYTDSDIDPDKDSEQISISHPKSRPQGRVLEIILAQVESIVAQIEPKDTARALEDEAEAVFIRHGWRVERQFRVEGRGDGRRGFVDMVAWSPDGIMVALELDRQQPRQKSVDKLRHLDAVRCILLRETSGKMDAPDGIDLVYGLAKTDPRVRPVLTAFYDAYKHRFGKPPPETVLNFGRDGKRVKKLPPAYTAEELLEYIERFFRPDTPGWVTRDFSFQAFLQAIPRLQEVASGEHAAVSGGHAASGRGGNRASSPHRGREATTRLGDRLDRGFFAGALQDDTA